MPLFKFVVESLNKLSGHQVVEIRGDWRFLVDVFQMTVSPTSTHVCYKCKATLRSGPQSFASFGPDAAWVGTQRSNKDFLLHCLPDLDVNSSCPLLFLRNFHVGMLKPCFMHVAHLGVGMYSNGSAMKVLLDAGVCGQGSKDEKLRVLWLRFLAWRKQNKIQVAFPRFRGFLLKDDDGSQVWYQTKAWHSRVLTGFLAEELQKWLHAGADHPDLQLTAVCLYNLAALYNAVEAAGRWLSDEVT